MNTNCTKGFKQHKSIQFSFFLSMVCNVSAYRATHPSIFRPHDTIQHISIVAREGSGVFNNRNNRKYC